MWLLLGTYTCTCVPACLLHASCDSMASGRASHSCRPSDSLASALTGLHHSGAWDLAARSRMANSRASTTHSLQERAQSQTVAHFASLGSKEQYFKMEQEFWALPLVLVFLGTAGFCPGSSNPQPTGHVWPSMTMNAAQHKIVNLLKTLSDLFFVITCHNVFNVWPRQLFLF